ncbi:thyroid peroxidase-like [Haliotis rufescens]|uniref:thyroid peroxidase-like n=1 Tax=Haliotis rufescens TaxID=6454 RepID=UPI001EB034B4|nr:thyroid peroxidase-like [Haliotis rufescens]
MVPTTFLCLCVVSAAAGGGPYNRVWHIGSKRKDIMARERRLLSSRVSACVDDFTIRPLSGICNNLNNPGWGAPLQDLRRLIAPDYDDGKGTPRFDGLPSPRAVSTGCFSVDSDSTLEPSINALVMQWGQFMAHDYVGTPKFKTKNCCSGIDADGKHPDIDTDGTCFPIAIPSGDRHFNDCIPFTRSEPSTLSTDHREQMNMLTSYIDGNTVYGGSVEENDQLRTKSGGLMATAAGSDNLPPSDTMTCAKRPGYSCLNAGDFRANSFPGLAAMHTLWVREHNRLAVGLAAENANWNDERLFQEARKIVIASLQRITYNDWLVKVLGQTYFDAFNLGATYSYADTVNPGLINSFGTAANRFGHSQIRAKYRMTGDDVDTNVEDMIMDPSYVTDGFKEVLEGLLDAQNQKTDDKFPLGLTDHLLENVKKPGDARDLISFNIQRGRDHGLPPYAEFQAKAVQFAIDKKLPTPTAADLSCGNSLYTSTDDADLYVGAIKEEHVSGGLVGPTFAYIMGQQYSDIRFGDRFWHETTNTTIGFTTEQLAEIRKVNFARVICVNAAIATIQKDAFKIPSSGSNDEVSCHSLDDIDLSKWAE